MTPYLDLEEHHPQE